MIEWRGRSAGAARLAAGAVLLALLAGCGGDPGGAAEVRASPKVTVVVTDSAYVPAKVRISVGSRVTFVGRSGPNTAETAGVGFFELDREKLDRQNEFDVHVVQPGEAESVEFDTPGVYRYLSSLNSEMKGVIEVVEPSR
jgi:plastocyanin